MILIPFIFRDFMTEINLKTPVVASNAAMQGNLDNLCSTTGNPPFQTPMTLDSKAVPAIMAAIYKGTTNSLLVVPQVFVDANNNVRLLVSTGNMVGLPSSAVATTYFNGASGSTIFTNTDLKGRTFYIIFASCGNAAGDSNIYAGAVGNPNRIIVYASTANPYIAMSFPEPRPLFAGVSLYAGGSGNGVYSLEGYYA